MKRRRVRREHPADVDPARWNRVRRRVLSRDRWRCRSCFRYGNECDHRVSIEDNGDWWAEENLQILCRTCHIRKTSAEARLRYRRNMSPQHRDWVDFTMELMTG